MERYGKRDYKIISIITFLHAALSRSSRPHPSAKSDDWVYITARFSAVTLDENLSAATVKTQKLESIGLRLLFIMSFTLLRNCPRIVHFESRRGRGLNARGRGGVRDTVIWNNRIDKRLVFSGVLSIWRLGNIELKRKVWTQINAGKRFLNTLTPFKSNVCYQFVPRYETWVSPRVTWVKRWQVASYFTLPKFATILLFYTPFKSPNPT